MYAEQPDGDKALASTANTEYVIAGPFGDCLLAYYLRRQLLVGSPNLESTHII